VFFALQKLTKNWFKKKGLSHLYQQKEVLRLVNKYFTDIKKTSLQDVRAISFNRGVLIITCRRSGVANEIRMEEDDIKYYLRKFIPEAKIKKILFRLIS